MAGGSRNGSKLWECKCDCGNTKLVTTRHLNRKNHTVTSCGCNNVNSPRKQPSDHPFFKGYGVISGTFFGRHVTKSAKRRSKKGRDIEVTIDSKYLDELWHSQKGRCAYTNQKLTLPKKHNDRDYTASVDRIDSTKGYIEGNVQFVCRAVNLMKNQFTHSFFLDMCKKVVNNIEQ